MKLANWNVAKPVAPGRRELMLKHIEQVRAEVLVLTETHDKPKRCHKPKRCQAEKVSGTVYVQYG